MIFIRGFLLPWSQWMFWSLACWLVALSFWPGMSGIVIFIVLLMPLLFGLVSLDYYRKYQLAICPLDIFVIDEAESYRPPRFGAKNPLSLKPAK